MQPLQTVFAQMDHSVNTAVSFIMATMVKTCEYNALL